MKGRDLQEIYENRKENVRKKDKIQEEAEMCDA